MAESQEGNCELNHVLIRPEKQGLLLPQTRFILIDEITKYTTPGEYTPMNPTVITAAVPLHILLRRRRQELSLFQSQLAETLHVRAETIAQWEGGRRRMELSKIPRIAAALQIDARELCAKALAEFHPLVYATLFGDDAVRAKIQHPPV